MADPILTRQNNAHPQWWKDAGLRRLNFYLVGTMLGSVSFGYDASLISGLLSNQQWFADLNIASSQMEGLVIAAQSFGAIGALIPAAYISDLIGRRWTVILADVVTIATVIGQSFCRTSTSFLGTRLLLGFFSVWSLVSTNALVIELSHPRQRAQVTALCNTFFYLGSITAAWTNYGALTITGSWSWRLPVLIQISFPAVQILFLAMTPESPRWLLTKGHDERAKDILICYHANGVHDDEMVDLEFREAKAAVEAEERGASYSWLALFSTKGNIKRTVLTLFLGLSSQWVGNGIISYYLAPILESIGIGSSRQQIAINGGLQIFNWAVSAVAALLAERLGRRTLLLISAIGMILSMSVVTACSATYANTGDNQSGTAVIVFLFLFFGAYDVGFTPIPPLYVNEIASTHLRAKYSSLYWFSTAVALCFNQYVNPIAFDAITWKYYFVYISVLCPVIAVLYFYAPETKGRALEQVAAIFDGDIVDGLAEADNETKTEGVSEHREFA